MSGVPTEVLSTQSKAEFDRAVRRAAEVLQRDEVVAVPTETVYGLAANALSSVAVKKIFQIKGRPSTNPLIVHVASWSMVEQCCLHWDGAAEQLARTFWPGPLTIVVKKSNLIPDEVTAGGETVALRWPSHPIMQALIQTAGFPLAAPSANRSNALSPTQAAHVLSQLDGRIPLIIDGGHSAVGIESTVVDLVRRPARILRPGMIHLGDLERACETLSWADSDSPQDTDEEGLQRSPGQLKLHYSPRARLKILTWSDASDLEHQLRRLDLPMDSSSVLSYQNIPNGDRFLRVAVIPDDAEAYARALFSELHVCDEMGSEYILVEAPPEGPEWNGVWDRLRRAEAD